ncbi:MAG: hypothetical protein ABH808_04085 [Candidatus Kuenenbacteria bacterium]
MINKKEKFNKIIFLLLFFCFLITPLITTTPTENNNKLIVVKMAAVNAANFDTIKNQLNIVATNLDLMAANTDLKTIIGRVILFVLGFLGMIAIIMIIIGGLMWMTSGGSEDKAKKARGILVNAIIGLFIVLVAYVITYWVVDTLSTEILKA